MRSSDCLVICGLADTCVTGRREDVFASTRSIKRFRRLDHGDERPLYLGPAARLQATFGVDPDLVRIAPFPGLIQEIDHFRRPRHARRMDVVDPGPDLVPVAVGQADACMKRNVAEGDVAGRCKCTTGTPRPGTYGVEAGLLAHGSPPLSGGPSAEAPVTLIDRSSPLIGAGAAPALLGSAQRIPS